MAYVLPPILAKGTYEQFQEALETGIFKNLTRTLWGYIDEGEFSGQMIFVNPSDKVIHRIVGNNEKQDAAIAELREALDETNQSLTVLTDTVDGHTSALSTLQEAVSDLQDGVSALELTVQDHTAMLGEHSEAISGLHDGLESAESRIGANEGNIATLQSDVAGINDDLAAQETRLTAAEGAIATNTADIQTNASAIAGNTADIADCKQGIQEHSDAIEELKETAATTDAIGDTGTDEQGNPIPVTTYVIEKTEQAVNDAKSYTDTAMTLHYV